MGRKSDSLQHVLIKRVLPQVQNNKTGTAYKKHIKKFARWAKSVGYRTPEQITPDVVQDYEQYLEHHPKQYAPTTIHTYLAPVCAAAGVSMDRIRKPKRTSGTITGVESEIRAPRSAATRHRYPASGTRAAYRCGSRPARAQLVHRCPTRQGRKDAGAVHPAQGRGDRQEDLRGSWPG